LRLIYSLSEVLIIINDMQRQVKGSEQWEWHVLFASDQLQLVCWGKVGWIQMWVNCVEVWFHVFHESNIGFCVIGWWSCGLVSTKALWTTITSFIAIRRLVIVGSLRDRVLSTGKKIISVVPLVPLLSAFSITNGQKLSFKLQIVGLLSCRGKYLEAYKSSPPTLDRLRRLKRVLAGSINVSGCVCDWWCWANAPQIFPRLVGLVLLVWFIFCLDWWGACVRYAAL
jgi:hypothetical protein